MARPVKPGLNYFPMDVDIEQDEKIALVEAEHGLPGFAIIIKLLLRTYKRGYFFKWGKKEQLLFSKSNNVDINLVNVVINDCLEWGLFNRNLFEKYKILTSHGIQARYLEGTTRRLKVEMYQEYLLLSKKEVNDYNNLVFVNINPHSVEVNVDTGTQTKLNEIKEEEIKDGSSNSNSDALVFYQQNFGVLKPLITESIIEWCKDLSDEVVIAAMKITIKNGANSFSYAETILKDWASKKLTTIDEIKAYEMQKKAQKEQQKQSNSKQQFFGKTKQEPLPKWMGDPNWNKEKDDPKATEEAKRKVADLREQLKKRKANG